MGATLTKATLGLPPNGGNGVIRTTTRRRHADSQPLMLQNPHRRQHGGRRRGRRAWPRCAWAAGPGWTTSRRADRSSRCGSPKRAAPRPPPAKFRMQFPRSANQHKLKNRRISTIRTQTPTCAHGKRMRNCWLTAIAGHQGDAPNRRSAHPASPAPKQPAGPQATASATQQHVVLIPRLFWEHD